MKLVFFTHPEFLQHQSMPRFANMLTNGMRERGHSVTVWTPSPRFVKLPFFLAFKKWLGYIDQFAIFPTQVKRWLAACDDDTLFIFTDHTLGPWVPLVTNRPNIIHSHDFLAQRSALGEIQENPTKWTGRVYQALIRRGYSKGKNFIAISKKTREDLQKFHLLKPDVVHLVYNGLNGPFMPRDPGLSRKIFSQTTGIDFSGGYILHVGGNSWYKNRLGVIEIYNAWRKLSDLNIPLVLIGEKPSTNIFNYWRTSPYKNDIYFQESIGDNVLHQAYGGASVFVFPSYAEGFGWPIAEAMASGCPVITTNEAPMTEVGGNAGFYIPRKPLQNIDLWADECALKLEQVLHLDITKRAAIVDAGITNAKRFDTKLALDRIEEIYANTLKKSKVG